jgi:hypothetical protein
MKLTDAQVAKALGWKKGKSPLNAKVPVWTESQGGGYCFELPAWTTSLNAIVGEIEARELKFMIGPCIKSGYWARVRDEVVSIGSGNDAKKPGLTAPLALCAALLAYLKEQRP